MKHKYYVSGIFNPIGIPFEGICISRDIKDAIDLFISKEYSVHKIERKEQVNIYETERILNIKHKPRQIRK